MKKLALLLLALTTSAHALLSPTRVVDVDKTNGVFTYRNLIKNDGFEKGTRNWTASGGTFTVTTTAANIGDGSRAASWDSSAAGQTFCSDLASMPNANKNRTLEAGFSLKCASGTCTHLVQTRDISDNVLSSVAARFNGTDFQANYTELGAFGTTARKLCLVSVAANEPEVFIDESYMSNARNVGSVAQAQLVGTVKITGCSTAFSGTSATFSNFSTVTGCSYATTGVIEAPSSNLPAVRLRNQPAGRYVFQYTGAVSAGSSSGCSFRFTDGTNTTIEENYVDSSTVAPYIPFLDGSVEISNGFSDSTFNLQYKRVAGSGSCLLEGRTSYPGVIKVYRYPLSSEIAVRPETQQNWGSALLSLGSATSFSHSSSTWTDITNASYTGYTLTGKATAIGSSRLGVTLPSLPAGTYQVIARLAGSISSAEARCNVGIFDGTTRKVSQASVTGGPDYSWTGETYFGTFNYTSQADRSFYLQLSRAAGTGTCVVTVQNGAAGNQPEFEITVYPISQSFPAPNLVGSVTSTSAGSVRALNTRFGGASDPSPCTSSPCTIYDNPGNWVTSVTRTTTGEYVLNLASNTFSSKPSCTCSDGIRSGQYSSCQIRTSLTSMNILIASHPGTPRDDEVNVICVGPRGSL